MSLPETLMMEAAQGPIPVPVVGFGTWDAGEGSWCEEAVLAALNAGYRHLDCAWSYGVSQRSAQEQSPDVLLLVLSLNDCLGRSSCRLSYPTLGCPQERDFYYLEVLAAIWRAGECEKVPRLMPEEHGA